MRTRQSASRAFVASALALFVTVVTANAQTVTGPSMTTNVVSGNDWASKTFQDPIDMSQYTDISWWAYSNDSPLTHLSGITYSPCTTIGSTTDPSTSCFKATTTAADGNIWILETGNPFSANIHKNGDNFPIDANTHKMVAVRMRLQSPGNACPAPNVTTVSCAISFLWNQSNLYDGVPITQTNAVFSYDGWGIYLIDLTTIGLATGSTAWSGTRRDLRFNLTAIAGANVEIDWIRLVPNNLAQQTISWSSFGGNVDIYLDSNQIASDGNLGLIIKNGPNLTLPAKNVSGSSYTFPAGALAPGDYFVEICPAGIAPTTNGTCIYSAGAFRVNGVPTFTFTSPSPEGSSDEFATTVLGNPWDMNALSDVDFFRNISGLTPTTVSAVDEAGASLGNVNVLQGTGTAGDPYLYPLWFTSRGATSKIDSNKYHILTVEAGIPNQARDINTGSIIRMVWQVEGERASDGFSPRENVSNDIIFNHRAGANVMTKIITDMKTLSLDPGASPSTTGWTGNIESFRFDPDEFPANTPFYLRRVKLAANERATTSYTIQWNYSDPFFQTAPSLTLSYDTDTDPSSGLVTIATGLNPTAGTFTWNTSSLPDGTYFIHASYTDGLNTNSTYSRWPIIVGIETTMTASPTRVIMSTTKSGSTLVATTPAQEVAVAFTGTSPAWTATANQPWVQINGGSGTGSGRFTVSLANPNDVIGASTVLSATITVSAPSVGLTKAVPVTLTVKAVGATSPPIGTFDTPAGGPTVLDGSFAVTGWAVDDIGIDRVELWRDRVPGETTPVFSGAGPGNGKIFIATPLFISGARPDVEAAYGTYPMASRAGWGYLLLSWGLWAQGNGTYTLYAFAFDKEGNATTVGTKSIVVSNANAVKPFGALDTPTYGQTVTTSFWNYGWALTPNPNAADPRTCTITNGNVKMAIDSGTLVPVNYGDVRTDIASQFPGFSNGPTGAGGAFFIDTSTLSNGTHQIGWFVTDNCGRSDGIGSRFFTVLNGASGSSLSTAAAATSEAASTASVVDWNPVWLRNADGTGRLIYANGDGTRVVWVGQSERIEVQLPTAVTYQGYQLVNGERRSLPTGSSLDAANGVFAWQPAAGFLGNYDLEFVAARPGERRSVSLRVVVGPSMRMSIDAPQPGGVVTQPFLVGGWAADLAAANGGVGVDAVHVWAYPADGRTPIFVGVAEFGDSRPDVGTVYGRQFENVAFNLIVNGLTQGVYDLVIYPHRVETGTFDGAQVVRVTVR